MGQRGLPALRSYAQLRPVVRVWLFTTALAALAAVLYAVALAGHGYGLVGEVTLPWPLLAAGFCLAELKVVDVHYRREKHSFSLSEFPAVIALFTLTPAEYLLAVLVGSAVALVIGTRQPPTRLAFNLANFGIVATLSLSVFHAIVDTGGSAAVVAWIAAFAATLTAAALSSLTIATAISLSGGAPQFQKLPEMIQFGSLVAIANTSLALLAVSILGTDPMLLALLVVPLGTVFLAYRAYLSEREKHEQLELLYQSSRILQHSPELDSALTALIEHARNMFRAEHAEIVLYPRMPGEDALVTATGVDGAVRAMAAVPLDAADPILRRVAAESHAFFHVPTADERAADGVRQAMIAPLRGESGLIGSMRVANRLTEGTAFGDDDLRLLETLANQAAVALENGQLEQSLAELSRLKEQLRYQAYHDPLTGLANRSLFTENVDERLARPLPGSVPVVLFVDLDDFKVVNDTLGHAAGDRLLVAVAERVRQSVRSGDVAARLGGDEFGILMDDTNDLGRAVAVTHRLLEALKMSFPVEGHDINVTASIGIATARSGVERADELLRNADVAMYMAKGAGKARFAVFDPTMHAALVARHALTTELSRSVDRSQLAVQYQPILELRTGEIAAVEALVRWRHPVRGLVPPDEFIPLAEESGMILVVGRWVLAEACREAARWKRASPNLGGLLVTVNLSAAQLQQPDFVEDLGSILDETGFPASSLVLEMTETAMFHDTQTTIARLHALRGLGVRIAIDDFGTGYSSIGYLRRFQVDILKIAREFVGPSDGAADGWAFAHAIVALGRTLGLRIVAEGIEEPGQLARLQELGCEYGQGFLFAQPMDGDALIDLLRRRDVLPRRAVRAASPDRHAGLAAADPALLAAPADG